jgi:hypothetical protein
MTAIKAVRELQELRELNRERISKQKALARGLP